MVGLKLRCPEQGDGEHLSPLWPATWGLCDQDSLSLAKASRSREPKNTQTKPYQVTAGYIISVFGVFLSPGDPRLPQSRFPFGTENNDPRKGTAFIFTCFLLKEKSVTVPFFAHFSIFPSVKWLLCLGDFSEGCPSSNAQWLLQGPAYHDVLVPFCGKVCLLTSLLSKGSVTAEPGLLMETLAEFLVSFWIPTFSRTSDEWRWLGDWADALVPGHSEKALFLANTLRVIINFG